MIMPSVLFGTLCDISAVFCMEMHKKGLDCELRQIAAPILESPPLFFNHFNLKGWKKERNPRAPPVNLQSYLDVSIHTSDQPLCGFLVLHGPVDIIELKGEKVHLHKAPI